VLGQDVRVLGEREGDVGVAEALGHNLCGLTVRDRERGIRMAQAGEAR
jgi:hypothetical protein